MIGYLKLFYYLVRPNTVFLRRISKGIGDNLLLSMLARKLKEKDASTFIVVETPYPELFENNPNVDWAMPLHFTTTKRFIKPKYHIDPSTQIHLTQQMLRYIGIDEKGIPELYLTREEIDEARRLVPGKFIAICPEGKQTHSANIKEWDVDRFQRVVDLLPDHRFVQIGAKGGILLEGVQDMRGLPLRESAAIMANADLFVGLEGGLMHMSRAVGTRSVVIYGGFIHPRVSAYDNDIVIYIGVDCSPCFTSDVPNRHCDHKKCMTAISPEMVIDSIRMELDSGTQ